MGHRIIPSAREHGVTDDDIDHAIAHTLVRADLGADDEDSLLNIGPDLAGNLLEVIVRSGFVVHAMPVRKRYLPLLRWFGRPS